MSNPQQVSKTHSQVENSLLNLFQITERQVSKLIDRKYLNPIDRIDNKVLIALLQPTLPQLSQQTLIDQTKPHKTLQRQFIKVVIKTQI